MKLEYIALTVIAALLTVSCTKDKEQLGNLFESSVYIETDAVAQEILFKPIKGEITETRELKAGIPVPAKNEIKGTFVLDKTLVSRYTSIYGEEAELFPEEQITIDGGNIIIDKGAVKSSSATITFSGIEKLSRSTLYVAPVRLTDVEGIDMLDSKSIIYYVFRGAALINVVPDVRQQYFPIKWKSTEVSSLPVMTFEALINIEQFGTTKEKTHQSNYVFGNENKFLVRISDIGMDKDVINIVNKGSSIMRGSLHIPENQWAHIAIIWDSEQGTVEFYVNGEKDRSNGYANSPLDLSTDCTLIPIDSSEPARYFNGMMSEVRVWSVRRTPEELKDNVYYIDPKTPGLIAYWKMDEGKGTTIKDYTGHGNDISCKKDYLKWVTVSLPEEETPETPEE